MAGRLTTHVLDTGTGKPAAGLEVTLRRLPNGTILTEPRTNTDGRVDVPLLEGKAFLAGSYKLHFEVGDYFRAACVALPKPPFPNVIPIRFGLAETRALPRASLGLARWLFDLSGQLIRGADRSNSHRAGQK